jgi:peptide/nickel transport system ATP-binding protein
VEELVVHYPAEPGLLGRPTSFVHAVDGVTLEIQREEIVGLVGESGCGKSTLAHAILRLVEPTSGRILFDGQDVTGLTRSQMRPLRRRMQITFQDPGGALDPRMTAGDAVAEALVIHRLGGPDRRARVGQLLGQVGLGPEMADRFPHQLSGGQRQRVSLARALAVEPELLVLDEPVAGLDVSVQAQVVNLLSELQERLKLAYLFVSHDLRVVAHLADRVAVMYLGQIVEAGPAQVLFDRPRHPYTRALLAASIAAGDEGSLVEGEPPSPVDPPPACRFHPRCPHATERCRRDMPPAYSAGEGHSASCFLLDERADQR